MMLTMGISLVIAGHGVVDRLKRRSIQKAFLWSVFLNGTTAIALLMGRVDVAFYVYVGLWAGSGLWSGAALTFRASLQLLSALALCVAFATHQVWLVAPLLLLQMSSFWNLTYDLRELIRKRPTRAEYVARSREACAAGGG